MDVVQRGNLPGGDGGGELRLRQAGVHQQQVLAAGGEVGVDGVREAALQEVQEVQLQLRARGEEVQAHQQHGPPAPLRPPRAVLREEPADVQVDFVPQLRAGEALAEEPLAEGAGAVGGEVPREPQQLAVGRHRHAGQGGVPQLRQRPLDGGGRVPARRPPRGGGPEPGQRGEARAHRAVGGLQAVAEPAELVQPPLRAAREAEEEADFRGVEGSGGGDGGGAARRGGRRGAEGGDIRGLRLGAWKRLAPKHAVDGAVLGEVWSFPPHWDGELTQ
eukprot:CAMPEP_0118921164 /NCGR_PEP_ID=MMETSP1169-20130426/535_1 /TAXON_ID=36882 /ORGANISM="Pyramimonas obovata, Strain CCMP722" /LENGTH=274 /DNA_ID=CAMNT_0006861843 /DNA_START=467 /DNA_END=1291 /DNA_ORIENTATION=-